MNANPTPPPPAQHGWRLWLPLLCLNVFFFSALLAADPQTFGALGREDSWAENLTAVWFLLAGILLFVTARAERSFLRRCVYILGGMATVFAAGEEISWGQRIFGFATPDFLMPLNASQEFNVHNIDSPTFSSIYRNGTLISVHGNQRGLLLPKKQAFGDSIAVNPADAGLSAITFYDSRGDYREFLGFGAFDFLGFFLRFIVYKEKGLLLLLLIFALLSGQVKWSLLPLQPWRSFWLSPM